MNTPSVFQRFFEQCPGDLRDEICSPHLDDVIVYSETFSEQMEHARTVLRRLKAHGMKLKLKKCNFLKKEVAFLGRLVSEHGYRIDPENTRAMSTLKGNPPKAVGDVKTDSRFAWLLSLFHKGLCENCSIKRQSKLETGASRCPSQTY